MSEAPTVPTTRGAATAPGHGARIGRFATIGTLGTGGMGVVLEAYDPELDRRIAIKLLHTGGGVELRREAQAMARLSHPNIVAVYEVGRLEEQTFIAMELVDGVTLRRWLVEPRPWREVLAMFIAAGRGLAAAHAADLVHRDFKPENVLIGSDGRPRVTDFGLVDAIAAAGTPAYMSPEHWTGDVDARADQYSFCVAAQEALAAAPAWVHAALRRGRAPDPADRWPSMDALLEPLAAGLARRPPRALAVGAAAALVAGVTVYAVVPAPARAPGCERAADAMKASWNDDARARVRAGLSSVEVPYASGIATRAIARLDDYADGWSRMSVDACEATHVRHQQSPELLDRRTACLESRRAQLAVTVEQLADHPDTATLDAAVKAAHAIEPVDACADHERLLAVVAPPPAEQRERAAALETAVAAAHTRYLTGHYRDGWAALEPVLVAIRALDHPPLTARALLTAAELQGELDGLDPAIAALAEAIEQAARARDDELAARAGVHLLKIVGHKQRKLPEADLLIALVAAQVARAGDPPALRARYLCQRGEVEDVASRYDVARAHLEEALALGEQAFGPDHIELIATLNALGNTCANLGRFAEARRALERALAIVIAQYGADHPNVGKGLNNLGYLAQQEGDLDAALDYHQRGLAAKERALGHDNASTARSLANVAIVLSMQGQPLDAVPRLEEAIAIFERTLGADNPEVAQNLGNLGTILGELGRADEGRRALERALAIETAAYGADHGDLAYLHEGAATLEQRAGNPNAALAAAERALAIRRAALGEDHPLTGSSWGLRGSMLASAGRCAEALPAFETGRAILARGEDPDSPRLVQLLTLQALCLVELDRADEAVPIAEAALELAIARDLPDAHRGHAQLAAASARHAAGTATVAVSRQLALEAAASLRRSGAAGASALEATERWLAAHP